jgi:DNA-binding transcriptional LysR family regulator
MPGRPARWTLEYTGRAEGNRGSRDDTIIVISGHLYRTRGADGRQAVAGLATDGAPGPGREDPAEADATTGAAPLGVELRHLRYFMAVADAGTFTLAAQRLYVAQPTLSQQIRRLEEMVGTPLLQRRREGVRLTEAGTVLLAESRTLLSVLDHGLSRTRQVPGLERPRLRFVVPPYLPVTLAVQTASRLRSIAADAGVEVAWMETVLDAEFSAIRQRRADAGLGWLTSPRACLPAPLDVMKLGEYEPQAWVHSPHRAPRAAIRLDELARMDVIHGPRRLSPATYDSWLAVLQAGNPRFEFTEPPFRNSLSIALAFAATGSRPTAVLTGPHHRIGAGPGAPRLDGDADTRNHEMVAVRIERQPLVATAGLVWSGELPRKLQQLLFDTAEGITA